MKIEPYLFFQGNCEAAIKFYKHALDAEVEMVMRYRDSPEPPPPGTVPAGWDDKIMHAGLRIGGKLVMASDGCSQDGAEGFRGIALSLSMPEAATVDRFFSALAEEGEVQMPLGQTFWSPRFGMVTDRFGVLWMINQEEAGSS
jgi:PhnB protein